MNQLKTKERLPRSIQQRHIKVGNWNDSLKISDVNQMWIELHRIVSSHPLVRASKRAGFLVEEGKHNAYTDLTQELFVALLSKDRFQHYIDTNMSDAEIEAEISQIELTNMLTAELRKRYPESYRLARRVSTLIQTSAAFKRFDNVDHPEMHRRLADRLYGLADWTYKKSRRDVQEMDERVKAVSFLGRDTRMVGCTGDAQIVISNPELEKLIIRVFKAIDSPVDVRSLRSFVMSRLPIMDIHLVPVGSGTDSDDDDRMPFEFKDTRETPEEDLLRNEAELAAAGFVDNFLKTLNKAVRGKSKQYDRMINVLWHCYLISDGGTVIRMAVDDIKRSGRATQGVIVMRLREAEQVSTLAPVVSADDETAEDDATDRLPRATPQQDAPAELADLGAEDDDDDGGLALDADADEE